MSTITVQQTTQDIHRIFECSGFNRLTDFYPGEVESALRKLSAAMEGADDIRRAVIAEAATRRLREIGVRRPAALVRAALESVPEEAAA